MGPTHHELRKSDYVWRKYTPNIYILITLLVFTLKIKTQTIIFDILVADFKYIVARLAMSTKSNICKI